MKKIVILLAVILVAVAVVAQDSPKAEVFGGYAYTNVDTKDLLGRQNLNGWDADVAFHATKNFSIVADISGAYKSESATVDGITGTAKLRAYNYVFGPRFSFNSKKVTPFVEALFGANHVTVSAEAAGTSASLGSTSFAMALGGGLDVNANKHVAIRLAKFDYMLNRVNAGDLGVSAAENLNNFRFATGIVFKF